MICSRYYTITVLTFGRPANLREASYFILTAAYSYYGSLDHSNIFDLRKLVVVDDESI